MKIYRVHDSTVHEHSVKFKSPTSNKYLELPLMNINHCEEMISLLAELNDTRSNEVACCKAINSY